MTSSSSSSSELIPFNSDRADPENLHPTKYDVFISFRGLDVRDSFLSHLYLHLNDVRKLAVYKDDVDLQRGVDISPSLLQAIEISDVYVVILSHNYADSVWCVEELEKIFECVKQHNRMFIPVTYCMSFSDFDKMLPSSAAAAGNIQRWRAELCKIISRAGLDYQVIRPETKLIQEITKAVFQAIHGSSKMVQFSSYSASRGLVGLERKMKAVKALLRSGDTSNRTIGLWGMAGIGKTTLAKAFFDLFSYQFEGSYFFSNFADAITSGPTGNLQNVVFSELLGSDRVGGALSYDLKLRRLGRIRALLVIDDVGNDVGNIGPLKDLLNGQYCDLFKSGSVVIMTSRNRQLLKSACSRVFEVEALDITEASRLFCLLAFREESVPTEYLEMVGRAMRYMGGNPLAITVLGAHLFSRDLKFWDSELGALQDNPNSVVENVFRRSFVGLTPLEKDIFLDLACFLDYLQCPISMDMEEIFPEGGSVNFITNLVDKSYKYW